MSETTKGEALALLESNTRRRHELEDERQSFLRTALAAGATEEEISEAMGGPTETEVAYRQGVEDGIAAAARVRDKREA
jgi:uncharacterized membrane protein